LQTGKETRPVPTSSRKRTLSDDLINLRTMFCLSAAHLVDHLLSWQRSPTNEQHQHRATRFPSETITTKPTIKRMKQINPSKMESSQQTLAPQTKVCFGTKQLRHQSGLINIIYVCVCVHILYKLHHNPLQ